jgi:uncharacterized membrane protein YjjP (DUF1212 family)
MIAWLGTTHRYALAVGIFVAALVGLVALLVVILVAGPLVAALTVVCVGGAVEAMRRYYREHRARYGA